MSVWEKFRVWVHYMARMNALKFRPLFEITPMLIRNQDTYNMRMYNATHLGAYCHPMPTELDFYDVNDNHKPTIVSFPWANIHIYSFEEFISKDRIKVTDIGDNWKERGYAQRIRTDYSGIYDWYFKI